MMNDLYARFLYPIDGAAWDVEHTRRASLAIGKRYLLEAFIVSQKCTDIWINGVDFPLNASHFQIESATGSQVALSNT